MIIQFVQDKSQPSRGQFHKALSVSNTNFKTFYDMNPRDMYFKMAVETVQLFTYCFEIKVMQTGLNQSYFFT